MTHDEMCEVIQAHKNGERIECRMRAADTHWHYAFAP